MLQSLRTDLAAANAGAAAASGDRAEANQLQEKLTELSSQNHKLHGQITVLTRERDEHLAEAQGMKDFLKGQAQYGEKLKQLQTVKDEEKLAYEAEIASLQAELTSQRAEGAAAEAQEQDRAAVATLAATVDTLENDLRHARQAAEAQEGQIEEKQKALAALNDKLSQVSELCRKLRAGLSERDQRIKELEGGQKEGRGP